MWAKKENSIRHKNRIEYYFATKEGRDKKAMELRNKGYPVVCYQNDVGFYIVDRYLERRTD